MLTSITIDGDPNIEIPIIGSTIANKYIIKSIDGLGPPDINVVLGDLAGDGSVYQNRRAPSRNPVIVMGLNPDYSSNETVDDLRDALYLALLEPGDDPIATIVLHDSAKPDRSISGYVESLDPAHFSKDPEVQISILCPSPFLKGADASVTPSVADTIEVSNLGSAPCGFFMDVTFTADTSGFQIKRDADVLLDLDYDFLSGDELQVNTIPGQRVIRRSRAGTWLNIIDTAQNLDKWPRFKPVADTLTLSTSALTWNALTYTPQWWGV
jgi:hypothetical protein